MFDEYLHIGKMNQNEIKCVRKSCFSGFEQGVNHAICIRFDQDTDQYLWIMDCNSFVADKSRCSGVDLTTAELSDSILFIVFIVTIISVFVGIVNPLVSLLGCD